MNRASSATGWARNPVMKSPELDPTQASSYELGWTLNPITGCINGCEYCYARKLANGRLKQMYLRNPNVAPAAPGWEMKSAVIGDTRHNLDARYLDPFYPRFWPDRLYIPFNSKPKGIFTVDMGELFGDWIPREWQDDIFRVIKLHPNDRFYLLTKQPQNLSKFSPFPDNVYIGVTATNRERFVSACTYLEHIWAKVKYLSLEPLLDWHDGGGVDIKGYLENGGINWLIIGAQSKPTVYPKPEWVAEITLAADKAGIPVFGKNNLKPLLGDNLRQELP